MPISTGNANRSAISTAVLIGGLEALTKRLVLPNLVTRQGVAEFQPARGKSVLVRVPTALKAKRLPQGGTVEDSPLVETEIPVTLDTHSYSSVKADSWDLTVNLESYAQQVVAPQVDAVAEDIETRIAAELNRFVASDGKTDRDGQGQLIPAAIECTMTSFHSALVKADRALNENNVPLSGRVLVINPAFREVIMNDPAYIKAADFGSSTLIQQGAAEKDRQYMGTILGFSVYLSNFVTGAVAFVKEAFCLAIGAPEALSSAGYSGSLSKNGYGLRHTKGTDMNTLSERSVVDAFSGATIFDARRAIGIRAKSV
ncbi:P22 phage major capsid protein family protein [Kitasatospora sp. NPDC101801]|uniref:P22 phage major capsid protein family protein n=1 Tax=Kitasatospora sp. NPDC101801 TaxID=3364103 RepID=UPI0037FA1868